MCCKLTLLSFCKKGKLLWSARTHAEKNPFPKDAPSRAGAVVPGAHGLFPGRVRLLVRPPPRAPAAHSRGPAWGEAVREPGSPGRTLRPFPSLTPARKPAAADLRWRGTPERPPPSTPAADRPRAAAGGPPRDGRPEASERDGRPRRRPLPAEPPSGRQRAAQRQKQHPAREEWRRATLRRAPGTPKAGSSPNGGPERVTLAPPPGAHRPRLAAARAPNIRSAGNLPPGRARSRSAELWRRDTGR